VIGIGAGEPINARSVADRRAAQQERWRRRAELSEDGRSRAKSRLRLGAAPLLVLTAALGLLLVAVGNNAALDSSGSLQQGLFWIGLVLIYAPIAFRLVSSSAGREERIALALTLAVSLFLVKVLRSPTGFTRFDELGWWRATHDVVHSGGAFSHNPIVVSSAGFPGLAMVTAGIAELTGLSVFHAGLVLIGVARLILILALFLLLERTIGSARAAGIGVVVYACNPSFLYFDAQFGYESLALTIATALLLATLRWSDRSERRRPEALPGTVGVLVVLALMLVITHHMTTLAALAFCGLWTGAILALSRRRRTDYTSEWLAGPGLPAVVIGVAAAIWFALVAGGVTVDELGGVFSSAFHSVLDLIVGNSGSKQVFSGSGQSEPLIGRTLAFASVVPLLTVIALGVLKMWRDREQDPLRVSLAGVAVLYPVTLALRLTAASSETSQRASEFVFIGVAFLAATLIVEWDWTRRYVRALAGSLAVTAVATVTFVGGFIVGELQATRQPGPYLVGAEDRSITSEGIAAARFASAHLPARSRILADRTNATLLGSYGGLDPVFGKYADISLPQVLFSNRFDRADRRVVHGQSLTYVVVDTRLTRELPLIGYYVESDEEGAFDRKHPILIGSLRKFESIPAVSKVYSNGPISIYDTSALLRRPP
jgi:hypothetical protein